MLPKTRRRQCEAKSLKILDQLPTLKEVVHLQRNQADEHHGHHHRYHHRSASLMSTTSYSCLCSTTHHHHHQLSEFTTPVRDVPDICGCLDSNPQVKKMPWNWEKPWMVAFRCKCATYITQHTFSSYYLAAFHSDHLLIITIIIISIIDNRILISRHRTHVPLHRQNCHQFHEEKIWRTLRRTGFYWAEEYATSQLHRSSCTEVNKYLLAYVILFKRVNFYGNISSACTNEYLIAATF